MDKVEKAYQECLEKIPGLMLRNRSMTTSSIYCKTPDGYSLRIGDHKGIEKWSYKWNLRLDQDKSVWTMDHRGGKHVARFYTSSVDDLAAEVQKSVDAKVNVQAELTATRQSLKIAIVALEDIEEDAQPADFIAARALKEIRDRSKNEINQVLGAGYHHYATRDLDLPFSDHS
jgi:hypothetical protein